MIGIELNDKVGKLERQISLLYREVVVGDHISAMPILDSAMGRIRSLITVFELLCKDVVMIPFTTKRLKDQIEKRVLCATRTSGIDVNVRYLISDECCVSTLWIVMDLILDVLIDNAVRECARGNVTTGMCIEAEHSHEQFLHIHVRNPGTIPGAALASIRNKEPVRPEHGDSLGCGILYANELMSLLGGTLNHVSGGGVVTATITLKRWRHERSSYRG